MCWYAGREAIKEKNKEGKKEKNKKKRELCCHILFIHSSAFVTLPVSTGGFRLLWFAIK